MDNFGGAAAWDRYTEKQEKYLRYDMENTRCGECANYEDGICLYWNEKVDPKDYAIEFECEQVTPA